MYYYKLNDQLSTDEINQLLTIQKKVQYEDFFWEGMWDGNSITLDYRLIHPHLPQWVWDRYGSDITCAFLKNKGKVIIHKDVSRAGVVTVPLTKDNVSYTTFYSDDYDDENPKHAENPNNFIADKLYHCGEAYLTNVSAFHGVPENYMEYRTFFQFWIRDKTWEESVEIFKERNIIKGSV